MAREIIELLTDSQDELLEGAAVKYIENHGIDTNLENYTIQIMTKEETQDVSVNIWHGENWFMHIDPAPALEVITRLLGNR